MTQIILKGDIDSNKLATLKQLLKSWDIEAEFKSEVNTTSKFKGGLKMDKKQLDEFEKYVETGRKEWSI
jgi:hypothetical protein